MIWLTELEDPNFPVCNKTVILEWLKHLLCTKSPQLLPKSHCFKCRKRFEKILISHYDKTLEVTHRNLFHCMSMKILILYLIPPDYLTLRAYFWTLKSLRTPKCNRHINMLSINCLRWNVNLSPRENWLPKTHVQLFFMEHDKMLQKLIPLKTCHLISCQPF